MAHADNLANDILDSVAAQIDDLLPTSVGAQVLKNTPVEMGESFGVWSLGADVIHGNADLSKLVTQTGRWHHQIRFGGKAGAFARSIALGPDAANWSVTQLYESDLAAKIDEATDWIDQNVKDDPVVRLLIVPAYHLHAFWIFDGTDSRVLVVDMPNQFSQLQYRQLYSSKEFLESLAKEQHVIGVN